MAIHIYMSAAKQGVAVDTEAKLNYRGEAGPGDDPVSFQRRMAKLGYRVELVADRVASEVVPPKREGVPQGPASVSLSNFLIEA